jgi:hypothetical protein
VKPELVVTFKHVLTLGLSSAVVIACATGCSSRQLYDSAQGWQRNECHRMQDPGERSKCLSSTSTSYDEFRRQSGEVKPNK